MGQKRYKLEEIIGKLREAEVLLARLTLTSSPVLPHRRGRRSFRIARRYRSEKVHA